MTNRLEFIQKEVAALHIQSTNECMREWFFEGHVKLVVDYVHKMASDYGANEELTVLGALFHDVARTWGVQDDPDLMEQSLEKAKELMRAHEYSEGEVQQVQEMILTHSCKEQMPQSPEGKVLATADALAHLMSDFYFVLPFNGWLTAADDFEGYKRWLLEKIERDFHKKIHFDQHRELARPKYEALKVIFKS